jgi:hypothetical protein
MNRSQENSKKEPNGLKIDSSANNKMHSKMKNKGSKNT